MKVALVGAGGKMGCRLSKNLVGSRFSVRHVEVSEAGRARLKSELGLAAVAPGAALAGADVVILAVPDTLIGKVAAEISPTPLPSRRKSMAPSSPGGNCSPSRTAFAS